MYLYLCTIMFLRISYINIIDINIFLFLLIVMELVAVKISILIFLILREEFNSGVIFISYLVFRILWKNNGFNHSSFSNSILPEWLL
jgi:hypothetical protein